MSELGPVWSFDEAAARFEAVVDRALVEGPQTIVQDGRHAVVVLSIEQWERTMPPEPASPFGDTP